VRIVFRAFIATCMAVALVTGAVIAGGAVAQAATCSQSYLPLPDPGCTPGSYNPDVTQSTIHSTICVSGWTATVRPPTSYTNPLKVQGIADYGYSDTSLSDYEEDHFVPLELGGDNADANLWPEPASPTPGFHQKDDLENFLHDAVCGGRMCLADAQRGIESDWALLYQEYLHS